MKQNYSDPATKQDLKKLEERIENQFIRFATKQDLEKFATKDDLENQISALETRTDINMEQMEMRIDDKARKYRDEVLTKMDGLTKDLKTILQELIMTNKRIDNHESKITKLEANQNHN